MRKHTYIQLRYVDQEGVGIGFHVEVSDDHSKAMAGFLKHDGLPQEATRLAVWCFQNPEAAAILHAAIERGEPIGTTWGEASSQQVARQLLRARAQEEQIVLDQDTAPASGASKGPRL